MTDTTPEYIAMCGCPEVQGRWNVTAFDLCYSRRDGVKLLMPAVIAAVLELDGNIERIRADYIYLPDQRAIQEWTPLVEYSIIRHDNIHELRGWLGIGAEIDVKVLGESTEQCLMQAFMDTVHGKQWRNGKWV